jgi:hypothetical protein
MHPPLDWLYAPIDILPDGYDQMGLLSQECAKGLSPFEQEICKEYTRPETYEQQSSTAGTLKEPAHDNATRHD